MIKGGIGGGNTKTGLLFESRAELKDLLEKIPHYEVRLGKIGTDVFYKADLVANLYKKHDLYRFLDSRGIDYKSILSKKLLPDDAIYVIHNNTVFIIEIKWQETPGSVDEKLQTCDFKKKQYKKLFSLVNYDVEYIYVLNDWFRKPEYKDTLSYIIDVGCHYYFQYVPLSKLGLPV